VRNDLRKPPGKEKNINPSGILAAIQSDKREALFWYFKTVLPDDGKQYPPIAHHFRGWEITYNIAAVRDWLFSNEKR
jgi:hypothetical protein